MTPQKYVIAKDEIAALLRGEVFRVHPPFQDGTTDFQIETNEELTNGDMVKLIFGITSKDMKWKCRGQKWWNTPYKREGDGE